MVSEIFNSSALWPGDACVKNTHLCVHHPQYHQSGCVSVRDKKQLNATERANWAQPGTGLGWSDPTFAHGSVAKVPRGVAPAHSQSLRPLSYTAAIG